MPNDFYKHAPDDRVWWVENNGDERFGRHRFSFDQVKIYDLFADYPHNLTPEEVELFDTENPFWADFFKNRKK